MQKQYKLWYNKPAPNRGPQPLPNAPSHWAKAKDEDWEQWSLPLGGGHFGVSVFGRTDTERLQITEVSLANPYPTGVNNFAEVYIDFGHSEAEIQNYTRDLVLNNATAHVTYDYQGTTYSREYFTSYPDAVAAVKLNASKKGCLSFTLRAEIPFLTPFGKDPLGDDNPMGKIGTVKAEGDTITLSGEMEHYAILYEGQIRVITEGGSVKVNGNQIIVESADSAILLLAAGTNYEVGEKAFTGDRLERLAGNPHPHERLTANITKAAAMGYDELRRRHVADYCEFFNRTSFDIGGKLSIPTDEMLENYKQGKHDPYLEELYFQYGRYLLISSSRKGTLPGNLQGLWNAYGASPWSAGYWHNINIQMNYWPAFTTNLAEMFVSYADMNRGFFKIAQKNADEYIAQINEENPDVNYVVPMAKAGTGENGWAVGTGGGPYRMSRPAPGGHSGPGTSALTAKMFWDYYDYTRDIDILKNVSYPILSGVANFLSKSLIEKDGFLLAHPSASPEQRPAGAKYGDKHYQTTGSAFDQQMIYENHKDTIAAAEILGIDDEIVRIAKEQLNRLDPIQIGESGQIKEYREETTYGSIGDPHHRHISHLKALSPGQLITSDTPEWVAAAKVTLTSRGDKSTGWAMAHRLLCWASVHDGASAYRLYQTLLKVGTLPNLWDTHPPFQIDGNYGGTAGVSEMLLQSNGNTIEPLPALSPEWRNGSYKGLVARGNFVVDCEWQDSKLHKLTITARAGGECKVRYPGITKAAVTDAKGNSVKTTQSDEDVLVNISKGETCVFCM